MQPQQQPEVTVAAAAAAAAAADFRGRLLQPPPLHPSFALSPFHPPPPPGPPPGHPPVGPPPTAHPHPHGPHGLHGLHLNHELFGGFGGGGGGGGVGGLHLDALKLKSEVAAAALRAVTSPFASAASQDTDVKGNVMRGCDDHM